MPLVYRKRFIHDPMTPEMSYNRNDGFLVERNLITIRWVGGGGCCLILSSSWIDVCRTWSAMSHCLWGWAVDKYHLGWWSFVANVKVVLSAKSMHTAELAQVSTSTAHGLCFCSVLQAGFRAATSYPPPSASQLREIWGCFCMLGLTLVFLYCCYFIIHLCIAVQSSIRRRAGESDME